MSTLLHLCLLLAAFSTLVSSKAASPSTLPAVYSNCSGNNPVPLPRGVESTPFFKPQIRINPLDINKNGTGWEEWLLLGQVLLPDGSELIYSCKWALGDRTSANISLQAFTAWAFFPNGTSYHQLVHGVFEYEEYPDGGFTYSIAGNSLTWDPVNELWNTSVDAGGFVIETHTVPFGPYIPFAPDYKSVPGQISDGFFSRIDLSRGHTNGYMAFPWGLNITVLSVGSLKHTWNHKVMADAISAYVRGSTFTPEGIPSPIAAVTWYQAWDPSGKEVDSTQFMVQQDNVPDTQVFRIQVTDAPEVLSIVTTPTPASLPLSYASTEITLPMCGPGADFEHTHQKMIWKATSVRNLFTFVDFAGGVTLYQKVNITGVVWYDGGPVEISGGTGFVEVYHR